MAFDKVLLVMDDEISRKDLAKQLQARYDISAVATTAAAQNKLSKENFDLVLADVALVNGEDKLFEELKSSAATPVLLVISEFGQIESAVEALNQGAFTYLLRPFSSRQLDAILKKAEEQAHLLKVKDHLSRGNLPDLDTQPVGQSPAINRMRALIRKVARTEATVLIQGESGAGKEFAARALFAQSPRAGATFIKVDCATTPEKLLDATLFGSGSAASGSKASHCTGCFELARGGAIEAGLRLDRGDAAVAPALQHAVKQRRAIPEAAIEAALGDAEILRQNLDPHAVGAGPCDLGKPGFDPDVALAVAGQWPPSRS